MTELVMKIDFEVADKITLKNLVNNRDMIKCDIEKHLFDPENNWMHPDDVVYNKKLLKALNRVIDYFGGENYYD